MKIMDVSGDDGECQVESVSSKTKKSKQGRLPFQTLSRDSPVANKKRKSVASPDVRNAKLAKVNTKENSFKVSTKTEDEDIVVIDEEIEGKEENTINEANDVKDCSKQSVSAETPESKRKKSTPGKGSVKNKKSEPKIQTNSLTKFFKKIENKETKNEKSTSVSETKEESDKKNDVNNKMTEQEKSQDEKKSKQNSDTESTKVPAKKSDKESDKEKLKEPTDNDESDEDSKKNSEESDDSSNSEDSKDESELNVTSNIDSDINLLSDDDEDDDNDGDNDKSDTDSKKTEHEETDSKDDTNRKSRANLTTPTRSKLLNSSGKEKKLTPKQVERKLEMQKKKESRAKQRLEREKKLQEERENRKKEKEEKRKEREEKRKEREEKEKMLKEQKKKEKEQRELKKQAEIEQKQKEKEAKEEERRKREEAKEEEKRRKEEERLEAERKKQKAASNFASFFVAKKPAETKPIEEDKKVERRNFMPFEIKADMRMAPTNRRNFSETEKTVLDKIIKSSAVKKSQLYINNIKDKTYNIRKSERTWPYEANDDVVILEDEEEENLNVVQASNAPVEKHRAKLLLFHENRRPPYWGTWRKKSKAVHPRRPFGKDTQWFDYEVDSDDEWEEEEPGESLRGSDDEKDEENADDNEYDVDNDFMVPHGYLSEEEIGADEEEEDEDDELNPEKQQKKLKILGEQFEAERNTKTTKLKPKVIGCVWLNKENNYPESTPSHSVKFLTTRHAWVREIPVTLTAPADADGLNDDSATPASRQSVASSARKAQAFEEAMPDLVRLLHGNTHRRGFLVKEFLEYWSKKKEGGKPLPKARLQQKITEVATWTTCTEAGPMQDKQCWIVSEEVQKKYLPEEKLTFPNQWTYCLVPRKKSHIAESTEKSEEKEKEKEKEKKLVPLITQFTKTLTAEEMQKQLAEKPTPSSSKTIEKTAVSSASKATPPVNKPPKRAALISVPRGEPFPKSPRVSLMDKFVTKDDSNIKKETQTKKVQDDDDDDDDIIMIIDDDEEEKDKVTTKSASSGSKIVKETSSSDNKTESKKETDVEIQEVEENDPKDVSANSDVDIIEI